MIAQLNLVTGATGLLGSHVVEQLVQRGRPVRAFVRPASDATFLKQLGIELCTGDLEDPASLRPALAGVAVVYHCAARVGDWGSWRQFRAQVIDATANLVDACRAGGVDRLVHVSSVSVYGHPRGDGTITEDEPLGQRMRWLDHYCRAKIRAEEIARSFGPGVTVVRPSWIFGPRDRNTLQRLANALRGGWVKILGDGNNFLNILPAKDVATGVILAADQAQAAGQAYHLCSPGSITQQQFLDALADELGLARVQRHVSTAYAQFGGVIGDVVARLLRWNRAPYISSYSVGLLTRAVNFSIEKAQRELGWQPQIMPQEAIRQAIAWLKEFKQSS
jgi:nucleoside-diphosphate-sugar epimerase